MIIFPILFLFLFTFKLGLTELTYNDDATCSVTNDVNPYYIYHNSVTYFRSPNFPETMYNSSLIQQNSLFCNARFDTETQNSKLWFVIFNGMTGTFDVYNDYEDATTPYFGETDYFTFAPSYFPITFQFIQDSDYYFSDWVAFEGIVYAYTANNLCPFSEQITKLESNRVIPIASSYDLTSNPSSNCKWTFSINPNQTLKIVFKMLSIYSAVLQLETDGQTYDFDDDVHHWNPIKYNYGSDSGIFTLSYNINDTDIYTKFFALVSVLDRNIIDPNTPKPICESNTEGLITEISNLNYTFGYSAFDSCNYQIPIQQNTEIILYVETLISEKNVDLLTINYQIDQTFVLDSSDTYYLTSDANGTKLDFSADGNTEQAGFTVQQTILNCQCAPSNTVIPCNGEVLITPLTNSITYCSNMACTYTINLENSCNGSYFILQNTFNLMGDDVSILYANNIVSDRFNSTSDNKDRIFSKNTNVTLQFSSGQPPNFIHASPHNWYIYAEVTEPNFLSTVQLTDTLPYHTLQMKYLHKNDAFVICSQPNDTLELFIPDISATQVSLSSYALYDSDNMDNFIADLDSPLIASSDDRYPRHISSSSGCFSIYMGSSPDDINLFFRMQNARSQNCLDTNNVFSIVQNGYTNAVGAANGNGFCEIILLAAAGYSNAIQFDTIQPSSNDAFKVSSALNQKIYFVTNSTNADAWKDTTIYNSALTITIPPNQSINVTAEISNNIYLAESGKNGIFASPNYGGFDLSLYDGFSLYTLYSINQIYNLELKVQYMDGNGTLVFYNADTNINVTIQANQKISQNGTSFQLFYQNTNNFTFLIEYTTNFLMTITTTTQTSPIPTTPKIVATNVTLDSTKPYYVFWLDNLSDNGYISVCSDYDDNLQLFVTSGNYLYNYILYDSNGLYNPVGDLSSNNIYTNDDDRPRSITSTSNCFTIVKTNGNAASLATLLFRRINQQSGNCYNNNIINVYSTIFSTNDAYTNNGNCETIFLASLSEFPIIPIDSIFSNSLITVKSAINGNSLASINSTDPSNWSNFVIYTNALSIISTQEISVQLMYANSSITKDKQFNQRGIMASPSYSGFSTKTLGSKMLYQLNNYAPTSYKMATGFVVKHLDSNCVVYIRNNDNQQNHTLIKNEKYSATGNTFEIMYEETVTPNSGFLIEYTLTSVNKYTVINLDAATPTYVYWLSNLQPLNIITVCSGNSDTLQMFATQNRNNIYALDYYNLYDSNLIYNLIGTLGLVQNTSRQISSTSGCFTLQAQNVTYSSTVTLYFRMRDAQSKNCIGSNIFEVQSYATTVSSLASSAGSCETIILSSNSYLQNPAIPINSFGNINSGSIILRSAVNQKSLVTIDSNNFNLWKSFKLYTPALSIVIPPNQSLQVSLDASDKGDTWISSSFKGQKGIVVSPAYNGFLQSVPGTLFSFSPNSCTGNCGINFKVNSTDDQSVTYNDERGNSRFFRQNDNITVYNSYVNLKYTQNSANSSFFITYTIVDSAVETAPELNSAISLFPTVTTLVLCFIITVMQN